MQVSPTTLGLVVSEAIQWSPQVRQQMFNLIKTQGTSTLRFEIPWAYVEQTQGNYNWATYADPLMNDVLAAGLQPGALVVIAHAPAWGNPAGLAKFMTALLKRYPWITAIEVYNEMNLSAFGPSPAVYTPLLISAYTAIKAFNPSVTVVLGGLAACVDATGWFIPQFPWFHPWQNYSPLTYLKAVHAAGGTRFYDVLGFHPYALTSGFAPDPVSPTQLFIAMIPSLADFAGKPIWATEFGFNMAANPTTGANQLGQELDILKGSPHVERAYVYTLRDNNGMAYGLYDANNVMRPAATVFRSEF